MKIKKRAIIILIIIAVLLSTSCRQLVIEKQSEYHDSIYDLELCLLEEYGDYYMFEEPNINTDSKRALISVVFLTSYINSDNKDKSLLEIMEGTRSLFNDFLADNPDCYLNDGYWIRFAFLEAPDTYDPQIPYETWGTISNCPNGVYITDSSMCCIDYEFLLSDLDNSDISFEGIREINVKRYMNTDFVLNLLERMPDVEVVDVSTDELADYYSEFRPDLQFV